MAEALSLPLFDVDAVAFDLDGTLLDTIHDLAVAVNGLLAELGLATLPMAMIRDLVGKGMPNLVRRALALAGAPPSSDDLLAARLIRYQEIYGELLGRETVLYPGVREGLDRMRAAGLKLAVVTNKATRFVRPHLDRAEITGYFDAIVGGDDTVRKKPDAAPLHLVAQLLGVAPSRLLMVGDSGNDVDAARAAGCAVLVLSYGYSEGVPVQNLGSDGIVDSLTAVADRVRRA
ncbi:MAG: phosphoglycolate phosphatase [Burkholderiales bacterium]|nr:phosphoglycolate phosphatase [Burkholderiales bacterium]